MSEKIYKILEKGLTVGNYSLPAGKTFSKRQWKFGNEALESAIKNGRCELIPGSDKKKKPNGGK